jgi:hypothetical protein
MSHAQLSEAGTINGTVTDQTGAVIPGAAITITNVGTGTVTLTTTNGAGSFSQVGLNVGNYSVGVMITGFQTFQENNFYLGPTQIYTANVVLKLGSTAQSIVVQAASVNVETASNEISSEVSGEEANMLALNGRNYQALSTLMPGVTNLSAGSTMATGGYVASNQISVNGMGRSGVFFTLDGIWNEETGNLESSTVTPPPEALDNVKVLQNNYSVQYNMMGGAVFMVHTKSGTEKFHGQAWYFFRDAIFNAQNYFVQPNINPPFHWNIGGFGIGGPLFIPHFYNTDRSKTFFYINSQYVNQLTSNVLYDNDPTAAERNGVFPGAITNPATGGSFPYNTIPQSMINQSALALLNALAPLPNVPSTCTSSTDAVCQSTDNYQNDSPTQYKQLNTMGKIDHIISPRLRLTAEYFREGVRDQLPSASRMGSDYPNNWDLFFNNDSVAQIHLIQQLSSTMLNQTSIAMDRYVVTHTYGGIHLASQIPNYTETLAYQPTIIGLPGDWLPAMTFSDGFSQFGTNSGDTQWRTAYLAETLTDNWSWLRGKHNLSAGGTFLLGRTRTNSDADNTTGSFYFTGDYSGEPIADFLLGYATTYSQGNTVVRKKLTYPIYSPYAEDQWRALPRLTLTAGVRYSFMPFANAAQGYATAFNPASFNPAAAPTVTTSGGLVETPTYNPLNGLVYNGFNGVPLNLSSAHESYFSPSIGFAWDIYGNGQTSLRGGYSINYLKSGSSSDCQANCIGAPVVSEIELTGASFPNPLNGKTTQATATSINGENLQSIQAAKIHSYSLSLQQQFGSSWLLEIAGAGVAARNLPLDLNINQPPPDGIYNFNPLLNTASTTYSNAYFAPFQGWNNITYATSSGLANWNALEVTLRHPLGHGVLYRGVFTWAHGLSDIPTLEGYAIENSGVQDSYNAQRDYGNSTLNQHLAFASDVIYSLPWFTTSGWTRTAFGGWQFSTLVSCLSGLSDSPGLATSNHALATRPNLIAPVSRYHGPTTTGPFFSTSSFAAPANGYFGNSPVGAILGPGSINGDISLFKNFPIRDAATVRLRGELFNALNHPNFNGQELSVGDANFGDYTSAANPREAEFAVEVSW